MSLPSPFAFQNYKSFMKARIDSASSSWGLMTRLAKEAGCQRSYLSQVMNGAAHLTPEHGLGLARYWELSETETEYFLTLLENARAATAKYRQHTQAKLDGLKRDHENLSKRLNRPQLAASESDLMYFSSWHWSALHILVSIPEFQTVKAISEKLLLPAEAVQSSLETLEKSGLVKSEKGRWSFAAGNQHVSSNSPIVAMHHGNWRQKAVLHSQTQPREGLHYTMIQAMDERAFEKIKTELLKFIDTSNAVAGPAPSRKLVCIACDFFEV